MEPTLKRCCICGENKPRDEYTKASNAKDGLQPQCRPCRKEIKRAEYQKHKAAYLERATKRYLADKDGKREYDREYRRRNATHLDEIKAAWRAVHADKVRAMKAAYKKRNPHIDAEHAMRRIARKRNATPRWLSEEHLLQMREIYRDAATRPGGPWHVDHIVPLAGKTVCGLHVPWNLRVIPAVENISKGNRLTADAIDPLPLAA